MFFKLTLPETGEYYIGVRSCECSPFDDPYKGSMKTWKVDKAKLVKQILTTFESREEANFHESLIIETHIGDSLNRNYCVPKKGIGLISTDKHKVIKSSILEDVKKNINYIKCNKKLAFKIGLIQSIIISYLYLKPKYNNIEIIQITGLSRKTYNSLVSKYNLKNYDYPKNFSKLSYLKIDINLFFEIGANATLIYEYFKEFNIKGKEFKILTDNIENKLPLTKRQIRTAMKILKEKKIISVHRGGKNNCNFYTIL
jgi:hypothetical protein